VQCPSCVMALILQDDTIGGNGVKGTRISALVPKAAWEFPII
jgi:hypothetical protein